MATLEVVSCILRYTRQARAGRVEGMQRVSCGRAIGREQQKKPTYKSNGSSCDNIRAGFVTCRTLFPLMPEPTALARRRAFFSHLAVDVDESRDSLSRRVGPGPTRHDVIKCLSVPKYELDARLLTCDKPFLHSRLRCSSVDRFRKISMCALGSYV